MSRKKIEFNPLSGKFDFVNESSGFSNVVTLGLAAAGADITGNFTVPDGVTLIYVECFGKGSNGNSGSALQYSGGGGSGGAYVAGFMSVTSGQIIPFRVSRTVGNDTWFSSQAEFSAGSAAAGVAASYPLAPPGGGTGGVPNGSLAKVRLAGADGVAGVFAINIIGLQLTQSGSHGGICPRGGVGGRGARANGLTAVSGAAGGFPGGGGGGGNSAGGTGGTGGNGDIYIWY